MTAESHPRNDQRSVDELINAFLRATDEDLQWNAIAALQWRGDQEVLEKAITLCNSSLSHERSFGAAILGQLGLPDRSFPDECSLELLGIMKTEKDFDVLNSVFSALAFHRVPDAIPDISKFSNHSNEEVRHAVVLALTGYDSAEAIETLIRLSNDPDDHVRDWATFALGTQLETSTTQIREALFKRIDDPDDATRWEALVGLARRQDERVIPVIVKELEAGNIDTLLIEAAELIASEQLYEKLTGLRGCCDIPAEKLEEAISASDPSKK